MEEVRSKPSRPWVSFLTARAPAPVLGGRAAATGEAAAAATATAATAATAAAGGRQVLRRAWCPSRLQVSPSPMSLWDLSSLLTLLPSLHLALPEGAATQPVRARVQSSWYTPHAPQAGRGRALLARAVEACLRRNPIDGTLENLLSPKGSTGSTGSTGSAGSGGVHPPVPRGPTGEQCAPGYSRAPGACSLGVSLRELQVLSLVCRRLAGATPASLQGPSHSHSTGTGAGTGSAGVAYPGPQVGQRPSSEDPSLGISRRSDPEGSRRGDRRRVEHIASQVPPPPGLSQGAPVGGAVPGGSSCTGEDAAEGVGEAIVTRERDTVTPECSVCGLQRHWRVQSGRYARGIRGLEGMRQHRRALGGLEAPHATV